MRTSQLNLLTNSTKRFIIVDSGLDVVILFGDQRQITPVLLVFSVFYVGLSLFGVLGGGVPPSAPVSRCEGYLSASDQATRHLITRHYSPKLKTLMELAKRISNFVQYS